MGGSTPPARVVELLALFSFMLVSHSTTQYSRQVALKTVLVVYLHVKKSSSVHGTAEVQ